MTDRYPIPEFLRRQPEQPAGSRERPILFSAPMVRGILDGSKSQTRRALKVQPLDILPMKGDKAGREWIGLMQSPPEAKGVMFRCKFGAPGDRLWVRESTAEDCIGSASFARYTADGFTSQLAWWYSRKACPSIHMPRWASRILLEITAVRVERLNEVSRGDAMAEGCPFPNMASGPDPREWYARLWDEINGSGSWAANPWVWVVEFRRIQP